MSDLEQTSDDALLKRFAEQGDREAMGVFFHRHADESYALAMRICRNSADAEDVVQNAFIKLMESVPSYRGGSEMAARIWLMRSVMWVAKNKIRMEVRRRNREEMVSEEQDDSYFPAEEEGQEADLKARIAEVMEVLDTLPEQHKEALWTHYCRGMSVRDAALALDVPEKTLRNTLDYGLKKLRQKLAERGVAASAMSIMAALPLLRPETAPASLLKRIPELVQASGAVQTVAGAGGAWSGAHWLKIAAIIVLLGGVGVAVKYVASPRPEGKSPAAAVIPVIPVKKPIHHRWDFNTPGVPPELECTLGKIKHIPNGGVDGKGCLEVTGSSSMLRLNVPVDHFPVVVKWRVALVGAPGAKGAFKSYWLPWYDGGYFLGLGPVREVQLGAWMQTVDYHAEGYIDRWVEGVRTDFFFGTRDPSGRLLLSAHSDIQIDDLVIMSISTNDLPDVSALLKVAEKIPADVDNGSMVVPELKSGRKDKPVRLFFMKGTLKEMAL